MSHRHFLAASTVLTSTILVACGNPLAPRPTPTQVPTNQLSSMPADKAPKKEPADPRKGPLVLDHVRVHVLSTKIEAPYVKDTIRGDQHQLKTQYMVVRLRVDNSSPVKKVDYYRWGTGIIDRASLRDEFDNTYFNTDLGSLSKVVGQYDGGSIYPGKTIEDVLLFQVPVSKATYLILTLPGRHLGLNADFEFKLPKTMWQPAN